MSGAHQQVKSKSSFVCPKCGSELSRISKTTVDKLINILMPVGRFKCYHCLWEGPKQLPDQE